MYENDIIVKKKRKSRISVLPQVFACGEAEFVIPFLTEASGERLGKKFECPDTFRPAEHFSSLTYLPAMVIDSCKTVILLKSDGVKRAGNRFEELRFPLPASLLEGT